MTGEFYEEDEDVGALLEVLDAAVPQKTMPSAALLRQVREVHAYSYEAGEYPPDIPESVARYLEPDGGLLTTLDLAIELLSWREMAEADASLIDAVAMRLDDQQHGAGGVWWNDTDETFQTLHGWNSREDFRQAYREMAVELLNVAIPPIVQAVTDRLADQLLPRFRDIVGRIKASDI